jgi:hypothetical protein
MHDLVVLDAKFKVISFYFVVSNVYVVFLMQINIETPPDRNSKSTKSRTLLLIEDL